jgi:predicted nicotinamide N-methyase
MPATPLALPPRTIARKAFTARWQWAEGGAPEGELSVATDAGFANRVPGYAKRYVCNSTECSVSNLVANQDYWYRVRRLTALSGESDWSKAMKVHTGLGMPVFTSLLFGGPVDRGPCQEFALTNLVSGAGELSVKSSDTNNVDVLLTENALFLFYLWRGPEATARLTLTLKHPETGYKAAYQVELSEATGSVVVVETAALTNAGKRLSQDVTIENRTGGPLYGVRLRADGLDNPEWMRNRTGYGLSTADPILEIPCVLPAGTQLVVRVLFHSDYAKQARKRPVEYRAAAIMAPLNELQPPLFGLPLAQNAVYESDEGMRLLGLPVVGNRLYSVGYSDDDGVNWNTNTPAIRATANYLMWLDLEASSNRVYEVKDAGKKRYD